MYPFKIDQDDIYSNVMGRIISFKFVNPKSLTLSKQINMISFNQKYTLKQEKIQLMRRLHTIQEYKEAILK